MSDVPGAVFLNGRLVAAQAAKVSAFDRGLLYGDGIFETVRLYAGEPFALEEHLQRMRRAAERIRLPLPEPAAWWRRAIASLVRRNGLGDRDGSVRITVTRGVGGEGLLPARRAARTILISARPLPRSLLRWQRDGVGVILLPFHAGLGGYLAGLKTTDYLTAALGKWMARERGAFEGIYQTRAGEILEGTTSNVFVVRDGRLETPPLARGVLAGITRARVLRLARSAALRPREARLRARDLLAADEAFLTASTIGIVPIRHVDDHRVGGRGYPVTRRLQYLLLPDSRRG